MLDIVSEALRWGTPALLDLAAQVHIPLTRRLDSLLPHYVESSVQSVAEVAFQLALSDISRSALAAHDGCMAAIRHHAGNDGGVASTNRVSECCRGALAAVLVVAPGASAQASMAPGARADVTPQSTNHIMVSTGVERTRAHCVASAFCA